MSTVPLRASNPRWALLVVIPAALALIAYSVFPRGGRVRREESVAATRLLDIYGAQKAYAANHDGSYADSLEKLELGPAEPDYIYSMAVSKDARGQVAKYLATADPRIPGKSGTRYFSVDQSGTVRYEFMRPPNQWSPRLER